MAAAEWVCVAEISIWLAGTPVFSGGDLLGLLANLPRNHAGVDDAEDQLLAAVAAVPGSGRASDRSRSLAKAPFMLPFTGAGNVVGEIGCANAPARNSAACKFAVSSNDAAINAVSNARMAFPRFPLSL